MKKTLVVLAVVASMVATMACGGAGKFKSDIDSLSYAIGADLGLNIRFSVEDLDLDQAMVADHLKDFLKNGDIESEEFMQEMQQMQMFQYTKFMPYMQAAMMHERSERTDTLPALPELYDEEFKREDIARYIGHSMAANVKGANIDLVMPFFNDGFNDAPRYCMSPMLSWTRVASYRPGCTCPVIYKVLPTIMYPPHLGQS